MKKIPFGPHMQQIPWTFEKKLSDNHRKQKTWKNLKKSANFDPGGKHHKTSVKARPNLKKSQKSDIMKPTIDVSTCKNAPGGQIFVIHAVFTRSSLDLLKTQKIIKIINLVAKMEPFENL